MSYHTCRTQTAIPTHQNSKPEVKAPPQNLKLVNPGSALTNILAFPS